MPSKLQYRRRGKRNQARTTVPQNQKNEFRFPSQRRVPSRIVSLNESSTNFNHSTVTSTTPPKMPVNLMDDDCHDHTIYYANTTSAPVTGRAPNASFDHSAMAVQKEEDLMTFSEDEDLDFIEIDAEDKQEVTKSQRPIWPERKARSVGAVAHDLKHHFNSETEQQPTRNTNMSLIDLNLTLENDLKYRNPTMKRASHNKNAPSTRNTTNIFSWRNMADALPNQTPKEATNTHFSKATSPKDHQDNFPSPLSSSSTVLAEAGLSESSVKSVSEGQVQKLRKPNSKDYHLDQLRSMIISTPSMVRQSYVMNQLCQWQIDAKKRCTACNKTIGNYQPEPTGWDDGIIQVNSRGQMKMPKMICKYHDGFVRNGKWLCCNKWVGHNDTHPCKGAARHKPRIYAPGELENYWQFYQTPEAPLPTHRDAVAFDCEMGVSEMGDSELIRLSVVDYFTCEVLVDKLVYPDVGMKHLSTRFSGVTWQQLEQARRRGDCLLGRKAAREAVWKFVGPETIVIGHSADNDLKALRWLHRNIVDTFTLERAIHEEELKRLELEAEKTQAESGNQTEATGSETKSQHAPKDEDEKVQRVRKPKGTGPLCLKSVAQKRLGREIQLKRGHDSKEDAIATRDIAQWHVVQGWLKAGVLKDLMDGSSIED